MERQRAFPVFDAITVDRIGAYGRKVGRHTRPRTRQKILNTKGQFTADPQKGQAVIGLALHRDQAERHAEKTDCLYYGLVSKKIYDRLHGLSFLAACPIIIAHPILKSKPSFTNKKEPSRIRARACSLTTTESL